MRREGKMQEERLVFTALRTRNYDRMIWFYWNIIGISLREKDHPPEGFHSEHSWHNSYLHFAIFKCAPDQEPTRTELSFNTNVEAVREEAVAAGVRVQRAPAIVHGGSAPTTWTRTAIRSALRRCHAPPSNHKRAP